MVDVLLVTCDRYPEGDAETALLSSSLAARGVDARIAAWSDPATRWGEARMVVLRSTWDYHHREQEFLGWIDAVAAETVLFNPAAIVHWNAHKSYLVGLAGMGLPVVPTRLLRQTSGDDLGAMLASLGWPDAVIKPAISADGEGIHRVTIGSPLPLPDSLPIELLAQPFLPSILSEGEVSVMWAGGVMEAVRKRPGKGEFRVQERWGGSTLAVPMEEQWRTITDQCLAVVGSPLLYARVDLVRDHDGWKVMELELIEPSLYLGHCPAVLEALVGEIVEKVTGDA